MSNLWFCGVLYDDEFSVSVLEYILVLMLYSYMNGVSMVHLNKSYICKPLDGFTHEVPILPVILSSWPHYNNIATKTQNNDIRVY